MTQRTSALSLTRAMGQKESKAKRRAHPRCNNRAARRSGGGVVRRGATCAHASQPRLLLAGEGPDSFFLGVVIVARDPAAAFLAALHDGEAPLPLRRRHSRAAAMDRRSAHKNLGSLPRNDGFARQRCALPRRCHVSFALLRSNAGVFFFLGSGRPVPFRSTRRRRFHWLAKKKPNEQQVEECEESDPPKHREEEEACFAERAVSLSNGTCCRQRGKTLSLCSVTSRKATQAQGRPFFLPSARSHDDASSCECMTGTSPPPALPVKVPAEQP